tara:strand:- start:361 stop:720 length:360 start_codon:yes stop_codon:yes gene_type:complete
VLVLVVLVVLLIQMVRKVLTQYGMLMQKVVVLRLRLMVVAKEAKQQILVIAVVRVVGQITINLLHQQLPKRLQLEQLDTETLAVYPTILVGIRVVEEEEQEVLVGVRQLRQQGAVVTVG